MNYKLLVEDTPVAHPLISLKMAKQDEATTTTQVVTTPTEKATTPPPVDDKENYIYEESSVASHIPDKINYVSSMDIRELSSKWLLSLRAKRNAANMRYPEWSSDFGSQLNMLPKCSLRSLEPLMSLESELTVQRLTVADPYDAKAIFRSFEEDFVSKSYMAQLTFSELDQFACQLDICRSPNGSFVAELKCMFSPLIVFGEEPFKLGLPCTQCTYGHECIMGQCKQIGKLFSFVEVVVGWLFRLHDFFYIFYVKYTSERYFFT